MKKDLIITMLNKESERLFNENTKQRISEAKNLQNFTNLVKESTLASVSIKGDLNDTNIGIIAIALLKNYLLKTTNAQFDFINEQTLKFKNGCYQLASIIKSRSAKPKDTEGLTAFVYIIYTPTIKGIYKVDKNIILNSGKDKIPASFVKQNGKLLREL